MTLEMIVIAAVRLLGALPVLRWPFFGGLLALLVDQSDLFMMNLLPLGGVRGYQSFDKYLDQAYLLAFLAVAMRCPATPRNIALGLYAFRLLGFLVFELTDERAVLLFFPNLFEFWFLLVAGLQRFRIEDRLSQPAFRSLVAGLVALKLFQEHAIHYPRRPKTEGTLPVPGLQGAITIRRDRHGIAYVDAEHEHDAWFGLGFCQAQDRAFQLELRLRTARGPLAARAGPQTLAIDRLSRRIGFHEASLRQLDVLDADVRAQIEAFVRGVNAGLAAGARRAAPAFAIPRARPTEWHSADVLAVGKLVAFLLIGNWDVELARLKILAEDGPRALRDLDPVYPDDQPVVMPPEGLAGAARDRLGDDRAAFVSFAGRSGGSNAWAIAGSRPASGRPILANDHHLEASLPPHWYL